MLVSSLLGRCLHYNSNQEIERNENLSKRFEHSFNVLKLSLFIKICENFIYAEFCKAHDSKNNYIIA